MQQTVNPTQADFDRIMNAIPPETPVTSLNLLRFRAQAAYPTDAGFDPCTGREAYQRYLEAVKIRVASVGGHVWWVTDVLAKLTAPENEEWDAVVAVSYPSLNAFLSMPRLLAKDSHEPVHRTAALEDARTLLIRTPELKS
ncbi:MAG: hypothetical protein ACAF41_01575 [Leptolyngbya sp. BL-A-14]